MEKYELNKTLDNFKNTIEALEKSLDIKTLKIKYKELTEQQLAVDFWNDVKKAQELIELTNNIKEKIDKITDLKESFESVFELSQIVEEHSTDYNLIIEEVKRLDKDIKMFELIVLLNGKYDYNNCYLQLQSGAGGTESMDWCMMLYRMYIRYLAEKKYKYEIIDYQPGEEAGLKSVSILVKGKYAYGYLKGENGVHRLVRISPFDSNKRRHTSFVSCEVVPQIENDDTIIIKDEDIRVDVYRSGGAGGQSVNTTDSAVRITHLETGIVVTCQNERSQLKNKETAMNILKSRLIQYEERKKQQELDDIKGEQKDIAWGSQIRSYVFHPYQMVKDHRTNIETSQVDDVMDGDLDLFINGYLRR